MCIRDSYWASPSGSGATCGTTGTSDPGSGYTTLAKGLTCMSGGDTLVLKNATYNASILSGVPSGTDLGSGATVVRAETRRLAILRPSGSTVVLGVSAGAHHIIFSGLVADGVNCTNAASCDSVASLAGDSHHIRFDDVEVKNGLCNLSLI